MADLEQVDLESENRSSDLVEPRWHLRSDGSVDEEAMRLFWSECFASSPGADLRLDPTWALSRQAVGDGRPTIYVDRGQGERGTATAGTLAVLNSRAVPFSVAPGLPWKIQLRGLKLASNQVLGDNGEEAMANFLDDMDRILVTGGHECLFFEDLVVDSPLWTALEKASKARKLSIYRPCPAQPHWWICLPEQPGDYWKRFSGKTRSELRRQAKKLGALECFSRREDVPEFLEKAHQISLRSWQAKRLGLRFKNSPAERKFWEFVAASGAMRCYILMQDGNPIAFEAAIHWNDCVFFEETGYDLSYSKSSPGTVLMFRVLEDLTSQNPPRLCDFGSGDAEYKRSFGNQMKMSGPVVVLRRSARPLVAAGLDRFCRSSLDLSRTAFERLGLSRSLRRLYRR